MSNSSMSSNGTTGRSARSALRSAINGILLRIRNIRLRPNSSRCLDFFMKKVVDGFLYLLGPILIALASAIISGLTYVFFTATLSILSQEQGIFCLRGFLHACIVLFVDFNIIYNYTLCVCTKNSGEKYDKVVRELADATGFTYPESEEEINRTKREYDEVRVNFDEMNRTNEILQTFNTMRTSPKYV